MRNYKKNILITYLSIIFLIFFIIFFIYLNFNYYYTYNYYKGIYIIDDICEIYVKEDDIRYLEKNPYVYLNSKRKKIKLISTTKINDTYSTALIKIKNINNKTKLNISIFKSKEKVIKMLIKPWRKYED